MVKLRLCPCFSRSRRVRARKYVVKKNFIGEPKRDDFEVVEYELPPLQKGDILIKVDWVSVDPYQRLFNWFSKVPYDQFGFQVGTVQESKDPSYPVGTKVVTHKGWCDYCIVNRSEPAEPGRKLYKLPNMRGLSDSLGLGAVGMPGATAYFAFLEICKPKPGETVVVSGAAGAVGSLVGQIAKIKGCKVIGFAGSDKKVQWLEQELGFDKVFNYKTVNVTEALKQAAPNGVDCYFDHVGGEMSSEILGQMNVHGRVSVVGSISSNNNAPSEMPQATILQPAVVAKQLKIEGFVIWDWDEKWPEAFAQLIQWIKSGQLTVKEHVSEGFDNIYDAFTGVLIGKNIGKAVVKI